MFPGRHGARRLAGPTQLPNNSYTAAAKLAQNGKREGRFAQSQAGDSCGGPGSFVVSEELRGADPRVRSTARVVPGTVR